MTNKNSTQSLRLTFVLLILVAPKCKAPSTLPYVLDKGSLSRVPAPIPQPPPTQLVKSWASGSEVLSPCPVYEQCAACKGVAERLMDPGTSRHAAASWANMRI